VVVQLVATPLAVVADAAELVAVALPAAADGAAVAAVAHRSSNETTASGARSGSVAV
jgi:hypothetical protein